MDVAGASLSHVRRGGLAGLRQLLVTEGKWRSGPESQPHPCHCVAVGVLRGLFWKLQSICKIGP